VNPPPTTPPPYCFPLQVFGRWTAIPQCTNLWPPEPTNPCVDSINDVFPRGLYSVHAALSNEGKVALWKQTYGLSATSEWVPRMFFADPNNFSLFSHQPITSIGGPESDMFCSGHIVMPDGRVLVAGGSDQILSDPDSNRTVGHNRSFLLDPSSRTWTEQQQMHQCSGCSADDGRRWYPTLTLLPDGRALVVSGLRDHFREDDEELSKYPEIFRLGQGWTRPSTSATASDGMTLYPFMHLIPDLGGCF
jgi:hypothetical protein